MEKLFCPHCKKEITDVFKDHIDKMGISKGLEIAKKKEDEVNTDFMVDVPDIPLPPEDEVANIIDDEFEAGFNFAIVGIGQGGSRLAETFWNLGYRRVCVINTAPQDLATIKMPDSNKLLIGGKGAG